MFFQQANGCVVATTKAEWDKWHEGFVCPDGHGQMEYREENTGDDLYGQPEFVCFHECPVCGAILDGNEEKPHT